MTKPSKSSVSIKKLEDLFAAKRKVRYSELLTEELARAWDKTPAALSLYEPRYCEEIIEHSRKLGGTIQSFAIRIGVHTDTLLEWARKHPQFSLAKRRAKQIQEEIMYRKGLMNLENARNFSGGTWIAMMKCRYQWREDGNVDDPDTNDLEFEYED